LVLYPDDEFFGEATAKMIICATDASLDVLRQTKHVVCDGNFKFQPKEFGQFYTIHAFVEGLSK
jgi:hypothetical protein